MHTCNCGTREAETEEILQVQGQLVLHSEFKASLGYTVKPVSGKRCNKILYRNEENPPKRTKIQTMTHDVTELRLNFLDM